MAQNTLNRLEELGQSVWLDFITRQLMDGGDLERHIREDSLRGMTTNPTIFSKAIGKGTRYDDDIRAGGRDADPEGVFQRIAIKDVQRAADFFRPVYDRTDGGDGLVSIEERPTIARDTEASIQEAAVLWNACDRPNVMIKIPGTAEGLAAIEKSLSEGINVNITLLFSVDRYREVMEAWFSAMEHRVRAGQPVHTVNSVASFFVSRVDVMVDAMLDEKVEAAALEPEKDRLRGVRSKFGIHNARLAYEAFEETFRDSARYNALAEKGARFQRPLWASTSTKDPSLPDTYYIDALVAPDTVNTMPPDTLEAFRDHGDPTVRIRQDLARARDDMAAIEEMGIHFDEVTERLEEEGVRKFTDSYDELLRTIRDKQGAVAQR